MGKWIEYMKDRVRFSVAGRTIQEPHHVLHVLHIHQDFKVAVKYEIPKVEQDLLRSGSNHGSSYAYRGWAVVPGFMPVAMAPLKSAYTKYYSVLRSFKELKPEAKKQYSVRWR